MDYSAMQAMLDKISDAIASREWVGGPAIWVTYLLECLDSSGTIDKDGLTDVRDAIQLRINLGAW